MVPYILWYGNLEGRVIRLNAASCMFKKLSKELPGNDFYAPIMVALERVGKMLASETWQNPYNCRNKIIGCATSTSHRLGPPPVQTCRHIGSEAN